MIKNVALASLVAASAVLAQDASQLHIDTPNGPVACQPTRITWGGGQPPYYVTILKGGESSGTPLADSTGGNPTSETSLTWWVNLEPGTSITATIKDSTGAQNSAAKVDVASGGNTDCISKPLSVSIAGAMATPSGSSNGETPQATDGGNQQGGGAVGGAGGDQNQQSQGGGDQQPSATPTGGDQQSQSAAPSGGNEQSAQSQSQSASQSAEQSAQSQSQSAESQSASAQSASATSAGNAASSLSSQAGSATSAAGATASSAKPEGGASALVPGFVAPALAAVVAAFAL